MARWRPFEDYSPLAQLLVHYMWEQRPPLLPAQFADKVGISRQTISRILNQDTAPEPAALLRMARILAVPSQTLFMAAGYTTEADPIYTGEEAWELVKQSITTSQDLGEEERILIGEILTHHQPQASAQIQQPVPHTPLSIATDTDGEQS